MRIRTLLAIGVPLTLGTFPLFAASPFIVESRSTGLNYGNYTDAGFADSSGNVYTPGTTGVGSRYSGTGSYFGPGRYAQYSFTPGAAGFYSVDLGWTLAAGQISTAVNIYTGAATGGPADRWGNASGPVGIVYSTTMNMLNNGTPATGTPGSGVWKPVTTIQMDAATTYKLGIYGGYKTPYAGGVTPADSSANRVISGAARFSVATPTLGAYGGPADGATDIALTGAGNDLSWAAGNYDSSFDLYFGTSASPTTKVYSGLLTTFDPDSLGLAEGTTYFWKVAANNVDVSTSGSVFSFTTMQVPEPSTMVLGLLGGLAILARRRRRA
jgi:PEP-CTERM motif